MRLHAADGVGAEIESPEALRKTCWGSRFAVGIGRHGVDDQTAVVVEAEWAIDDIAVGASHLAEDRSKLYPAIAAGAEVIDDGRGFIPIASRFNL